MSGEPVVETRDLVKRYGAKTVLNGLDLRVDAGQVLGFLGRNGAGKTTTLRIWSACAGRRADRRRSSDHDSWQLPVGERQRSDTSRRRRPRSRGCGSRSCWRSRPPSIPLGWRVYPGSPAEVRAPDARARARALPRPGTTARAGAGALSSPGPPGARRAGGRARPRGPARIPRRRDRPGRARGQDRDLLFAHPARRGARSPRNRNPRGRPDWSTTGPSTRSRTR